MHLQLAVLTVDHRAPRETLGHVSHETEHLE